MEMEIKTQMNKMDLERQLIDCKNSIQFELRKNIDTLTDYVVFMNGRPIELNEDRTEFRNCFILSATKFKTKREAAGFLYGIDSQESPDVTVVTFYYGLVETYKSIKELIEKLNGQKK